MSEWSKFMLLCGLTGGAALLAADSVQAASIPVTVYGSTSWTNASNTSDGSEATWASTSTIGSTITYDFGQVTSFGDVSVTTIGSGYNAGVPNDFYIQVSATDDPSANDWTTVGTASNLYGYVQNNQPYQENLGGRIYLTQAQNKRYFRFVNNTVVPTGSANPTNSAGTMWMAELQVQRPVVIVNAPTAEHAGYPNKVTDGIIGTASASNYGQFTGESGSLVVDVLQSPGNKVSGLTLTPAQDGWWYSPKDVMVYYNASDSSSKDPNGMTTSLASLTLTPGYQTNSIPFSQAVDARYFKLVWANTLESHGKTRIAEIGATYAPVPEPAMLGMLAMGAGAMLMRRRNRA